MPITISGTSGVTYPAGGTDNVAGSGVGTSDTQTLTNKTLTTPTIATIKSASTSPTVFQNSSGTEVGTLCRAWVNFQGGNGNTAGTINASFNVSSITVNGTGDYTVNFTNAMTDANYAVALSGQYAVDSSIPSTFATISRAAAPTSSAVRVATGTNAGFLNFVFVTVSIFR